MRAQKRFIGNHLGGGPVNLEVALAAKFGNRHGNPRWPFRMARTLIAQALFVGDNFHPALFLTTICSTVGVIMIESGEFSNREKSSRISFAQSAAAAPVSTKCR